MTTHSQPNRSTGRGFFGIGVYRPKTVHNIGLLWRSAHNMGAAFMFTIGHRYKQQCSDTTKAWKSVPLTQYADFDQMYEVMPKDCLLIGIEQAEGSELVHRVAHPERAIYLLGAEDFGLPADVLTRCHRIMEIPSTRCLNVGVAGSIVMYDRLLKGVSMYRDTENRMQAKPVSAGA